jgi:SAM-dependent methyltransferase
MFFADRIKNIKEGDRVLEIGPGADPHPRSDVLLEREYENQEEYYKQLGHSNPLITDRKVIFYDGSVFPFSDKEFDYVICSHVLEHVEDLPMFLSEIFRVSSKGYFEYPLIYYEYLYNIDAHLNVLKFEDGTLNYMKKSALPFNDFKQVQEFLLQSLQRGHVTMINDLIGYLIEGFEWTSPFKHHEVSTLDKLVWPSYSLPWPVQSKAPVYSTAFLLRQLVKKIIPVSRPR